MQEAGAECFAVVADATDLNQVNSMIEKVVERYGRLDILINNVGEFNWKSVLESTRDEWEEIIASNLYSVFYACKAAIPVMRRQRWGRIVNLGAVGAERAFGRVRFLRTPRRRLESFPFRGRSRLKKRSTGSP